MRRSLTLLQESYCGSESEEENNESSIGISKDKPQFKGVSDPSKDTNTDVQDKDHSKIAESPEHQDDTSDRSMNIVDCFSMTFSLHDIPLPPVDPPKDKLKLKLVPYSKESEDNIEINSTIESKLSDHKNDPPGNQVLISEVQIPPLSIGDSLKDISKLELVSYSKESKDNIEKNSTIDSEVSDHKNDSPGSQVPISEVQIPPLSIDDLEDKLQSQLLPFLKDDDNERSTSENSKTPLSEDYLSDSRVPISEESPLLTDASKVKLKYELESMCHEDVHSDETSGSEDSKSYFNFDDPLHRKMKEYSLISISSVFPYKTSKQKLYKTFAGIIFQILTRNK